MNQQTEGFKNEENDFKTTMNEIENELLSLQTENSENKNIKKKILKY